MLGSTQDQQIVALEVGAVVFDDVLVVAEPQNLYLLFDGIVLGETGGLNFDCVEVTGGFVKNLEDQPIGLAQQIHNHLIPLLPLQARRLLSQKIWTIM